MVPLNDYVLDLEMPIDKLIGNVQFFKPDEVKLFQQRYSKPEIIIDDSLPDGEFHIQSGNMLFKFKGERKQDESRD